MASSGREASGPRGGPPRGFLLNGFAGSQYGDQFQTHGHAVSHNYELLVPGNAYGSTFGNFISHVVPSVTVQGPINDGVNGPPRVASETRPINMSVVWIMKVKQSVTEIPALRGYAALALGALLLMGSGFLLRRHGARPVS
jgi:hypothetical protein